MASTENLKVEIELDPQQAYDNARVIALAWTEFSRTLAKAGIVCNHPAEQRQTVTDVTLCGLCGHVVPKGL